MIRLEDLAEGKQLLGILPSTAVTVVHVERIGEDVVNLTYKDHAGTLGHQLLYREDEPRLSWATVESGFDFACNGHLLRLVAEAYRIQQAYLFDPFLAVHTSRIDPYPHQITAVYECMLPRLPLRFLLADDPGSGKTIMTGLLIKELMIRGDLERCLIVCPGNLAEQWQDELWERFQLRFDILTNDQLNASPTGNWFEEHPLAIARLDKLSRDAKLHPKVEAVDWDLVVCDEAHKMSATYAGNEVKYTKRYHLGQRLSRSTRHFLLLTATPHNGKEADFQLFMALLDGDRFEGRPRDGVHTADVSDLMRRMIKEDLVTFEGKKLFPERIAHTVHYELSEEEIALYEAVTSYVKEEFNRAENIGKERKGTVGFALTTLQRRLASSPEAIYQSLRRRKERLQKRLREEEAKKRGRDALITLGVPLFDEEDLEDLEDAPEGEAEELVEKITDEATAAQTIQELRDEIFTLERLERLADGVRRSGKDRKWEELSCLLQQNSEMFDTAGLRRKLIVFTEHRDTLNYLAERVRCLLGRPEAVVTIHGGMGREDRRNAQKRFTQDKEVLILIATDAAGEGINLQRAHLMINYDLPWNPNRLEQRFGRIHRIGQTEVCHCWNLVARETREGEVYDLLLKKIAEQRQALGGRVFDVLGKVSFEERPLRDLLIEAIRYGDRPEVKERMQRVVDKAFDTKRLLQLLDQSLARNNMDATKLLQVREEMERAQARRLQPHYIASFFREAFQHLGGTLSERESRRYEIRYVPKELRDRDRVIGRGSPLQQRYERVTFEKELVAVGGKPLAELIVPGHPLLDGVIDLILERYQPLLKGGGVLVDETDPREEPRLLFMLQTALKNARPGPNGSFSVVAKHLQFVEVDAQGHFHWAGYAPYLDYRPLQPTEAAHLQTLLRENAEFASLMQRWQPNELEQQAMQYAVRELVPTYLRQCREARERWIEKVRLEVSSRLDSQIRYWDHRALELQQREEAEGTPPTNSVKARQRAEELRERLDRRMKELDQERQISAMPPNLVGRMLVLPAGLLAKWGIGGEAEPAPFAQGTAEVERIAMEAVMDVERRNGYTPRDVSALRCGYDIESVAPEKGELRFIEVKGRVAGARTVTITRNEILTALNQQESFILALVLVENGTAKAVRYCKRPFSREPDFGAVSVNYDFDQLWAQASVP
ncbi:MAG TPA: helicase-related protein [Chthonomonas sp.]|uniref:helicase-related protein n=1 Tax=Chthonomonas sp. TaxID=2282153 RepID=UPI002B4B767E|nr:helicase-related protein [Chthonomonas sp.]HLI49736.1 helicase-related protein [Chthonomonas sp.]